MHTKAATAGASDAPTEARIRNTIKKSIKATGLGRVSAALGLSDETALTLAGGLPVRAGTLALAEKNRYRQAARTAQEAGLGDVFPLDEAIPEI